MIVGIGTDILDSRKLLPLSRNLSDPFFQKTFTAREREEATSRPDPVLYFSSRFAAKEAVFKCFGINGNRIRLTDIEIMNAENGAPKVLLSGELKEAAEERGIFAIHLSLSWDGSHALAFAVAEAQPIAPVTDAGN